MSGFTNTIHILGGHPSRYLDILFSKSEPGDPSGIDQADPGGAPEDSETEWGLLHIYLEGRVRSGVVSILEQVPFPFWRLCSFGDAFLVLDEDPNDIVGHQLDPNSSFLEVVAEYGWSCPSLEFGFEEDPHPVAGMGMCRGAAGVIAGHLGGVVRVIESTVWRGGDWLLGPDAAAVVAFLLGWIRFWMAVDP